MTVSAEDRERALRDAKAQTNPAWGESVSALDNMARVLLDTIASNAVLEERSILCTKRIRVLLQCVYDVRALAACGEETIVKRIEKKLAEYDALAAANQKETSVETKGRFDGVCAPGLDDDGTPQPYRPKPGERARLVASPDPVDRDCVGKSGVLVEQPRCWQDDLDIDPNDVGSAYAFLPHGEAEVIGIHRDATWEPASPQVTGPNPFPQKAPEAAEPFEASEAFRAWVIAHPIPFKPSIRDAFEAGKASEAAAHAETTKALGKLKDELERVRAELEQSKADYADLEEHHRTHWERLESQVHDALTKAGFFKSKCAGCVDGCLSRIASSGEELATARAELSALREGREEPSDDGLALVIASSMSGYVSTPDSLSAARAAKSALLGVPVVDRERLATAIGSAAGRVRVTGWGDERNSRFEDLSLDECVAWIEKRICDTQATLREFLAADLGLISHQSNRPTPDP